jgi:multidrug efflux pump subunit AcrB
MLVSGTGKTATIGTLADMEEIPGETEIRRENLQRNVQVTARFEGSTWAWHGRVQKAIADLHVPPSIRVQYGGKYAEQQKVVQGLCVRAPAGHRAGVYGAAVRVRQFRRAHRGDLVGAALHCGVFVALVMTASRSISRRSWG